MRLPLESAGFSPVNILGGGLRSAACIPHFRSPRMDATLPHRPWTAAEPLAAAGMWRFARRVGLGAAAAPGRAQGPVAWQWRLQRDHAPVPSQILRAFALLAVLAIALSWCLLSLGASTQMVWSAVALMAPALTLTLCAQHAADRETITLVGPQLLVEQCVGTQVIRRQLPVAWLEVEPLSGQRSLVQLRSQGQTVRVGRFVRPEWRGELAHELRALVRSARDARWAGGGAAEPSDGAAELNRRPGLDAD